MEIGLYGKYDGSTGIIVYELQENWLKDVYKETENYLVKIYKNIDCCLSVPEIIDFLKTENSVIKYINANTIIIYNECWFLELAVGEYNHFKSFDRTVPCRVFGDKVKVKELHDLLVEKFPSNTKSYIEWYYGASNGIQSTTFTLEPNPFFYNEFYPFINNVDEYFDNFLTSTANVLILLGPPGTGKTSFIRELLFRSKESAMTTYDPRVMQDDGFYVSALKSDSRRFVILEDSDVLLLSREKDDNRVMNKILNSSDGLVKVKKKFIFTANILESNRIDEALTRPGRCFDVLKFRHLTRDEALVISEKLGNKLPDKDEYTLSEVFNGKTKKVTKLGF